MLRVRIRSQSLHTSEYFSRVDSLIESTGFVSNMFESIGRISNTFVSEHNQWVRDSGTTKHLREESENADQCRLLEIAQDVDILDSRAKVLVSLVSATVTEYEF